VFLGIYPEHRRGVSIVVVSFLLLFSCIQSLGDQ
jgi:hypothetical protein